MGKGAEGITDGNGPRQEPFWNLPLRFKWHVVGSREAAIVDTFCFY